MTNIYLVSHAEAECDLYHRIHGWYNSAITDNGFLQIKTLENLFRSISIDAVYSSDLYRAKATAQAAYLPKNLDLFIDTDLREIYMGDWEDCPLGKIERFNYDSLCGFYQGSPTWAAPNGETLEHVNRRMITSLTRIAQKHPNQTVAVFSHRAAIRQVLCYIQSFGRAQNLHVPSNSNVINHLTYENGMFSIQDESDHDFPYDGISTPHQRFCAENESHFSPNVNLWFRPIDWTCERELYLCSRRDTWYNTHINGPEFDGAGFLRDAEEHLSRSPWGVSIAMANDKFAGIVQLDTERYKEDGAGYIPFCFVSSAFRDHNLGIQLIGQAVSFFRPLGRDRLRLRCAPYNYRAQHFYAKYGFVKIGEEQGSRVPLDILEKYIGHEHS